MPKVWAAKVWREGNKASYFDKFISTDGSKPIQTNKDLKRAKGDKVTFGIAMNLTGDGVTGNNALVNNEDTLTMYDFSVTTEQVRNAVARYVGDDNKSPYENLPLIKSALVQWLADWKDDTLIAKLTASPTTGEVMGTEASITADNKLTCAMISTAKRKAMLHAPKVKPIKIEGQDKYIMLIGPYAARDLKTDTAWLEAQEHADCAWTSHSAGARTSSSTWSTSCTASASTRCRCPSTTTCEPGARWPARAPTPPRSSR